MSAKLRLLVQNEVFGFSSAGGLEPEVMVGVSPVQADGGGEFFLSLHAIVFDSVCYRAHGPGRMENLIVVRLRKERLRAKGS